MAEKDNIQLAEKQIAALNARDLDQYLSRIDDSYVGESETVPGPIRGRDGVRQNLEILFKAFLICASKLSKSLPVAIM